MGSGDLTRTSLGTVAYEEREQNRAALYVCSRAHDVEDARLLLDALGLWRTL